MDANNMNIRAVEAMEKTLRTIERIAETFETVGEKIDSKLQAVDEKFKHAEALNFHKLEALKGIKRSLEEVRKMEHNKLDKITKRFETVDAINIELQNVDDKFKKNLATVGAIENKLEAVEKIEKKFESVDAIKKTMQAIEENTRTRPAPMLWLSDKIRKEEEMVTVFAKISVVAIGDIDPVKQKFSCEFYVTLRWEDEKLNDVIKRGDEIKWGEDYWEPAIYFLDLENIEAYERNETIIKKDGETAQGRFYYHIKGVFHVKMDIHHFPFDYQRFTITMTSHWDISKVDFVIEKGTCERKLPNNIRTWNFAAEKEWDIQKCILTEKTFTKKEYCDKEKDDDSMSTSPNLFPLYMFKMYARRKYDFFLYNIALIMALITALTFSVYTVGADVPGDRIQISLTLLLTSVALKYVVNGYIPQAPRMTVLDLYILASMVFQSAMAVQNGISALIHSYMPRLLKMFESWSLAILLVIFIIIQGGFLFCWCEYAKSRKTKMQGHITKFKQREEKIDEDYEEARKNLMSPTNPQSTE
eukprot:gene19537-21468_t